MWIICGLLSVIFCAAGWFMELKKKKSMAFRAFACSLTFVSLTLLFEYRMVLDWVTEEDWSAMLDVVPAMSSALTGYVIVMIPANLLPMFLAGRKKE